MVKQEMRSVSCPTWVERAERAAALTPETQDVLSVYCFGLDHGPDNQRYVRMVQAYRSGTGSVMMNIVWCFLHQSHLIEKRTLGSLDKWGWSHTELSDTGRLEARHFSALRPLQTRGGQRV